MIITAFKASGVMPYFLSMLRSSANKLFVTLEGCRLIFGQSAPTAQFVDFFSKLFGQNFHTHSVISINKIDRIVSP
jgi:hypothetical protein